MSLAGLSIDLDSVASHLAGYGLAPGPDDGVAYRLAVPRILALLEQAVARATFFLIAAEAAHHAPAVAEIVAAGHEVASHSMTHRLPFHGLAPEELERETAGSKALLERLTGEPVVGFRAPSWDVGPLLLEALVRAGYTYDSSAYPSILLPLLRWSVARRGGDGGTPLGSGAWRQALGPARAHRRATRAGPIVELPVCTTPGLRLPYYHTLRYLMPAPAFGALRRLAHARRGPVWYQFHAVDFLGIDEDRLDERIERHPGMDVPLREKLALAERAIDELGRARAVVPLKALVEDRPAAAHGNHAREGA